MVARSQASIDATGGAQRLLILPFQSHKEKGPIGMNVSTTVGTLQRWSGLQSHKVDRHHGCGGGTVVYNLCDDPSEYAWTQVSMHGSIPLYPTESANRQLLKNEPKWVL